jgi:hypothetical protein
MTGLERLVTVLIFLETNNKVRGLSKTPKIYLIAFKNNFRHRGKYRTAAFWNFL